MEMDLDDDVLLIDTNESFSSESELTTTTNKNTTPNQGKYIMSYINVGMKFQKIFLYTKYLYAVLTVSQFILELCIQEHF
jgi:hypothetical protein